MKRLTINKYHIIVVLLGLAITFTARGIHRYSTIQQSVEPEKPVTTYVCIATPTPIPTATPIPNKYIEFHKTNFKKKFDEVSVVAVYPEFEYIGDYFITAYCPEECGYRVYSDGSDNFPNGWITATGTVCHREEEWWNPSTCGINTKYLNYGDILYIDGKVYVAEDTGYVTMPLIDLFMPSYEQMMTHGSHWTDVYRVSYAETEPITGWHFDINKFRGKEV